MRRRGGVPSVEGMDIAGVSLVVAAGVVVLLTVAAIRIVREYERVVVFRLGRLRAARGPDSSWSSR